MENFDIRFNLVNKENLIEKNYKTIPNLIERSTKSSIDDYEKEEIELNKKMIINSEIKRFFKITNLINSASNFWFKSNK